MGKHAAKIRVCIFIWKKRLLGLIVWKKKMFSKLFDLCICKYGHLRGHYTLKQWKFNAEIVLALTPYSLAISVFKTKTTRQSTHWMHLSTWRSWIMDEMCPFIYGTNIYLAFCQRLLRDPLVLVNYIFRQYIMIY